MSLAAAASRRRPGPWTLLLAAVAAQTGMSVLEQGVPTLAPFLKRDLGLSAAELGAVVSSFAVGRVLGSYAAGRAVDAYGDRQMMLVGGVAGAAAAALAGLLPLGGVVVALALAGTVSSTSTPGGSKLVLTAFRADLRGFAMGIRQSSIPLGGLLAALVLPFLADRAGWRTALAVAAAFTAAGAVGAFAGTRGAVRSRRAPGPRGRRHPRVKWAILWAALLVGGQYATVAYLVIDVERTSKVSLAAAAGLLALVQVGGIAGRLGWGAFSDRALGGRREPVLVALSAGGVAAALLLALLPGHADAWGLAPVALLAGLTLVGWQGMFVTVVGELAGPDRAGADVGFGLTFVALAIVAAPPLFGLVVDTGGFRAAWLALAAVLALSLVPALALRERPGAAGG